MTIVIDTNVLVSAVINPAGAPGTIADLAVNGRLIAAFDRRMWEEYEEVLHRPKFHFATPVVTHMLASIHRRGRNVRNSSFVRLLPDRTDEPFLEAAVAAPAEFLVTGNVRHFPVEKICGVRVVTPAEFVEIWKTTAC